MLECNYRSAYRVARKNSVHLFPLFQFFGCTVSGSSEECTVKLRSATSTSLPDNMYNLIHIKNILTYKHQTCKTFVSTFNKQYVCVQ